jgi:hypothetical protein
MDYNQHKAAQKRRLEILQFGLQAWVRYMKRLESLNRLTPEVLLWISGKMIDISREVIMIGSQPIPRYPRGGPEPLPGHIGNDSGPEIVKKGGRAWGIEFSRINGNDFNNLKPKL